MNWTIRTGAERSVPAISVVSNDRTTKGDAMYEREEGVLKLAPYYQIINLNKDDFSVERTNDERWEIESCNRRHGLKNKEKKP